MSKMRIAIIGGGIAGLSAGFFIRSKFGDRVEFAIYEKENRLGGTIGVTRDDGYTIDWGSNGFLDREPLTLDFIDQIGLTDQLLPSDRKSEKRFIYRAGKLWEIHPHPLKFFSSGLLSLRGMLRVPLELFVPAKKDDKEESVYDFASRRIGREAADLLIDPMVSGIFGGDPKKLELASCFPVMEQMEKKYGGLIKALFKRRKLSRKKGGGPAGPSGHLTSFHGGLYTLIERLESLLHANTIYPFEVKVIERLQDGKFLISNGVVDEEFDVVILAVPSYISALLVADINLELSNLLEKIPYSSIAVVCQGYRRENVGHDLDGFGFLIPHNQQKNILGSIWTSVIYPEQSPGGIALFRTMLGGARGGAIVKQGEQKLGELASEELTPILDLKAGPDYQKVIIWDRAIPQYVLGHRQRLHLINAMLGNIGGLYLAGNAYSGIGLNDTIKRSFNIVESLLVTA